MERSDGSKPNTYLFGYSALIDILLRKAVVRFVRIRYSRMFSGNQANGLPIGAFGGDEFGSRQVVYRSIWGGWFIMKNAMDLRAFLDDLQERLPYDFVRIERPVSPNQFEVTALLQHLENQKKFPVLFFEKPLDLNGKPSAFPLLSNVFATRQRCALSLGMKPNESELPLSLEYARREDRLLAPVTIPRNEAPVKQVIKRGDEANIYDLPVVRHHAMDPAPYIDMTPVMKDPDEGFYNIAFQRNMVKGPRRLGLHMSPQAQLADPSQERRKKPFHARGHCDQPSSGILFGLVERLSFWRGRLCQGRCHHGRAAAPHGVGKLWAKILWCRRMPRW